MSKATYVTRRRLASLEQVLTAHDRELIAEVDRLGLVSGAQLRRLHYGEDDAARRLCRLHLARLVEARVLLRLGRRIGGVHSGSDGFIYALDVAGRRVLDPNRTRTWPRSTPGAPFLTHALAVSELYVALRRVERLGHGALCRFDTEPACWRRFHGPGGARLTLKPDAHVVIDTGEFEDHYFVEIDRATEPTTRIADKARLYVRYWRSGREQVHAGVFPLVLWTVPDERRRAQLVDTFARLDAEHWQLFAVTSFDAAAAFMARVDEPPVAGVGAEAQP